MLTQILDAADPYISEAIFGFLATYTGFLFRYIFRTNQSQESLHKAIQTGVDLVTDSIALKADEYLEKGIPPALREIVTTYAIQSVPDAVKFLKADHNKLELLATAKIRERVAQFASQF